PRNSIPEKLANSERITIVPLKTTVPGSWHRKRRVFFSSKAGYSPGGTTMRSLGPARRMAEVRLRVSNIPPSGLMKSSRIESLGWFFCRTSSRLGGRRCIDMENLTDGRGIKRLRVDHCDVRGHGRRETIATEC